MSLFVSSVSAIFVLGYTTEMYQYGAQLYLTVFGNLLGSVLCSILFVPLFFPLKFTSIFEVNQLNIYKCTLINNLFLFSCIRYQPVFFQYMDWRFHSPLLRVLMALVLISYQVSSFFLVHLFCNISFVSCQIEGRFKTNSFPC